MTNKPLVSVVVPTFNSERFLERCLKSVKAQSYSNIEIIVIDNYSLDKTKEIANKNADLILVKGPERSSQVNFGVKHARGKYIYYIGSDFIIESQVIEEAVGKCEKEGFDAICIHNTSDPTISFWARVRKIERDCYEHDNLNVAARFLRKKVFELIGGFNESLVVAEDYDLQNKLISNDFKIGFLTSKEIHIGEPMNLAEIAAKHYYYGKTVKNFLDANPDLGKRQISPLRPAILRNLTNFAKHPILLIGFVVYQTVRYSAAGLGFLIAEINR